jgi:hypothetical protein
MNISEIIGKTFTSVSRVSSEEIVFVSEDATYVMTHIQDCCERVYIEDINGDLSDLENVPILKAEESSNSEDDDDGRIRWTFYHISTIKGTVSLRWYGSSNGYYSERVDFYKKGSDGDPNYVYQW